MDAPSPKPEGIPFGNLPLRPKKVIFNHNYIDLVALEVRWATPLAAVEESAALRIREAIEAALGITLSVVERVEQRSLSVDLGEGQVTQQPLEVGHVLRTQDQTITVSVLPQSVGIQVSEYTRWSESMKPLAEAVLTAVVDVLGPGVVSRTGLRYINRINDTDCEAPKDWASRLSPALVAPYANWGLQQWVHVAREQIDLSLDESHGARLQHGALSPTDYLIDVDVFSQRSRSVDVEELVFSFTRMNRTALAIFQQCVPLEYMQSRQPEGADNDDNDVE